MVVFLSRSETGIQAYETGLSRPAYRPSLRHFQRHRRHLLELLPASVHVFLGQLQQHLGALFVARDQQL